MKIMKITFFILLVLTRLVPISNIEKEEVNTENILNIEVKEAKVIVNLDISSIKDISYFTILLDYDENVLKLDTNDIKTKSEIINTSSVENPNTNGKIVFANIKDNEISDKNVAILTFDIIRKEQKTDLKIKCNYQTSKDDLIVNTRSELKGINL